MNSKLILIPILFLTTSVFAGNWFVGVNGGANVTRQTPIGDLPMARQEHGIEAYSREDQAEFARIRTNGGTSDDTAHLMKLQLQYSTGWNIELEAGYRMACYRLFLTGSYSHMSYENIKDAADDELVIGSDTQSGKTNLWTGLFMGEYILPILNNSNIEPIVSAGLGVSRAQNTLTHAGKKTTRAQGVFAYKFKVGINYNFTRQLQANIGTSFFGTSKIKATDHYLKQWQFLSLGVRWVFN